MRNRPSRNVRARVVAVSIIAITVAFNVSALSHERHGNPLLEGGPDGAGGIPYAGGPHSSSGIKVPYILTLGLVVDGARAAIPDVPLVVMANDGTIVATGVTDDSGLFAVDLPATVWLSLTISLPMNGVSEVPIDAGVPILIVVP